MEVVSGDQVLRNIEFEVAQDFLILLLLGWPEQKSITVQLLVFLNFPGEMVRT